MDVGAIATYLGSLIGFLSIILPILIKHESRLSRIEAKLDMLLAYHGIDPPTKSKNDR